MRTLTVYLETSIFNYYFELEREAHADTVRLFEEIRNGKYQAFTSTYAVNELLRAPDDKRDKMIALIDQYGITTLPVSEEANRLGALYVKEGIIPPSVLTDALHIAVATVNALDMILSLNFRHIVRKKTVELTALVNVKEGYRKVDIYAPMEVVSREEFD